LVIGAGALAQSKPVAVPREKGLPQIQMYTFACKYCNRTFTNKGALTHHKNTVHPPVYQCQHCNRTFATEAAIDQHINTVHSHDCQHCNHTFATEAGLDQHINAVHSHECQLCNRTFVTEAGLDQHTNAVHSLACQLCNRTFATNGALEQHANAIHVNQRRNRRRKSLQINDLDPPVSSKGYWIEREYYHKNKSFGAFECQRCRKTWISAHSFTVYRQGCQRCENKSLPKFMWINEENNDDKVKSDNTDGPHDSARCDACLAGKCKR